jgi:hypothetical protein
MAIFVYPYLYFLYRLFYWTHKFLYLFESGQVRSKEYGTPEEYMYRFYNISTVGNQFSVANSSPASMYGS